MVYTAEVWDGSAYIPLASGAPGARVYARVSALQPTASAVGDMWINPSDPAMTWDTAWRYPTLINGWQNYDASYWNAAKYRKMAGNVVAITGLIKSGTIGWTAFYLPPGYRPTGGTLLCNAQSADNSSRIDIRTDGAVTTTAGNPAWCSIELNFYAG